MRQIQLDFFFFFGPGEKKDISPAFPVSFYIKSLKSSFQYFNTVPGIQLGTFKNSFLESGIALSQPQHCLSRLGTFMQVADQALKAFPKLCR